MYLSHGVDQTYSEHPTHPAYSGGKQRDRVRLFLVPNEASAARERATYPDARVVVVGCPRLDPLPAEVATAHDPMVVAFAWHWDAPIVPESRWAWPQWREPMRKLAQTGEFQVIGTGHPRLWGHFEAIYAKYGIEAVADPNEVLARADVLAFDNTSVGFEAMACGLGVVGLNASWYRRAANHGLRFWDLAPRLSLWPGDESRLAETIEAAADLDARRINIDVTRDLYPAETRGRAAALAVEAILDLPESP